MKTDYKGKTILITGGGGGIGSAAARALYDEGANLVLCDRDSKALAKAAEGLDPNRLRLVTGDISMAETSKKSVQAALDAFGRLDVAVNGSGIAHSLCKLTELDEAEWQRVIAVNLTGVFHSMQAELAPMMAQNGGCILNIASVAGIAGSPGLAAYSASKHGVVGLTRSVSHEVARYNIRVNALCPGYVDTAMLKSIATMETGKRSAAELSALNPMRRACTPGEVVDAILWLCSDGNSFMTGQAIALDGGLTAI